MKLLKQKKGSQTNFFYHIILFLFIAANSYAQTDFISFGDAWSYYDAGMEPPTQAGPLTWIELAYDDATWVVGDAQLGYGDMDEETVIDANTLTGYFRATFNVPDPSMFDQLELNLVYDDGAVVYLNGVEVWRVNMPTGVIDYNTFATGNSGENATASLVISADSLVTGDNLIAVEVHQRTATSSDLSFDFAIEGQDFQAPFVMRGPYLQKGSPTDMVIKWRTSQPTMSIVDFGLHMDTMNTTVVDSVLKIDHELAINNLTANTSYFYQVRSENETLVFPAADLYFKTSPLHGVSQKFNAWILGDPGTANNNARDVRDAYYNYIGTDHTDMILFLGDNAYNDGTDAQYQLAVFENMYEDKLKNSVSWSTLGNHDGHSADSETQTGPYYEIFSLPTNGESGGMASGTEAYYSFDYANVHFIILDSYDSDRAVGAAMYDWCKSDLQNTTAEWIVAFWHHPTYTKGSHNSDTEIQLVQMRQNFLPLLELYGVDLVLSGHSHSYERSYFIHGHYDISDSFNVANNTVGSTGDGDGQVAGDGAYIKSYCQDDGAVYVTAGSSGKISGGSLDHEAMFLSVSELGSCVMEVDGNEMKFKFIRENGLIRDSFTIAKVDCDTLSTTVCASIASTYADVEQRPDSVIYEQSSDLELVRDNGTGIQNVGLIFEDMNIRRGSWIQSAYIQFMADDDANDVSSDSSYLEIRIHDTDNATIFTESLFDVGARAVHPNYVVWEPEPWTVTSEQTDKQRTPDLSYLIQPIVNRTGYNGLSNFGFTITGIGKRSAASFDNGSATQPAQLCVTYADCQKILQAYDQPHITSYAAELIVRSNDIFTNDLLYFSATQCIELEEEFEVSIGNEFSTILEGCMQR